MRFKAIFLGPFAAALIAGPILYQHLPNARAQSGSSASYPPVASGSMMAMHMPPPMPQSIYAGLWRVDHTFTAGIHIKNTMVANSVQVTPALFMADGTEYDLPPVNLGPNAVADVDINKALAQAPTGSPRNMPSVSGRKRGSDGSSPRVLRADLEGNGKSDTVVFKYVTRAEIPANAQSHCGPASSPKPIPMIVIFRGNTTSGQPVWTQPICGGG